MWTCRSKLSIIWKFAGEEQRFISKVKARVRFWWLMRAPIAHFICYWQCAERYMLRFASKLFKRVTVSEFQILDYFSSLFTFFAQMWLILSRINENQLLTFWRNCRNKCKNQKKTEKVWNVWKLFAIFWLKA